MADYIITTDNTADLPAEYHKNHQVPYMKLSYIIGDNVYAGEADFDANAFYDQIKSGIMPSTSQVTIEGAKEFFEPFLQEGKDILHIAFSSGLSGSCNNCFVAARELEEEYPQRKIIVIDSLCASLGEGLLVHYAVKMKEEGKSLSEVADYTESIKMNICHLFTVDDLNHLYRGGRVSKISAMAGSMIGIKPVLHVDDNGKLVATGKVRGRKASLKKLVENMELQIGDKENDIIFISHGAAYEDALFVQNLIKERFGMDTFLINPVGPVIGTHAGPGVIALFFVGKVR